MRDYVNINNIKEGTRPRFYSSIIHGLLDISYDACFANSVKLCSFKARKQYFKICDVGNVGNKMKCLLLKLPIGQARLSFGKIRYAKIIRKTAAFV